MNRSEYDAASRCTPGFTAFWCVSTYAITHPLTRAKTDEALKFPSTRKPAVSSNLAT